MFALQDDALRHSLSASAVRKPSFPTRRYAFDKEFIIPQTRRPFETRISVKNMDAIDVALGMHAPMVLILADAHSPGGCVLGGGNMQEESLFRRTTLFASLAPDMYPIGPEEALYARDVDILFDGKYASINASASFIACPGIKLPPVQTGDRLYAKDEELLKCKVQLIMQVAIKEGHTNLVLGALGCGVWGCPVKHVAEVFRDVLNEEYNGVFENVTFAILGGLRHPFKEALELPLKRNKFEFKI
jgi:uncharacterized protein (TIGR02452 family)